MKCQIARSLTPQVARQCIRPLSRCPTVRGLHPILLFTLLGACSWSQSLAIKRVTVIDATGRGPEPNMTVIADGDRIVVVGPWKKTHIPSNAVIVDGAGKFLIPGLWDMHVHGSSDARAPWSHLLFLANGVVGVRDMSGPPDAHAWRASHASSEDPSPTIYLGSPMMVQIPSGPNPLLSPMKLKGAKWWNNSGSVAQTSSRSIAGYPATPTSRSPTRPTSVVFRSKGMCRNR